MSKVSELVRFRFASCFAFDLKNCRLFCLHCNLWRKGAPVCSCNKYRVKFWINNSHLVNFIKKKKMAWHIIYPIHVEWCHVLLQSYGNCMHACLNSRRNCRGTISQTCFVMKFIGTYSLLEHRFSVSNSANSINWPSDFAVIKFFKS